MIKSILRFIIAFWTLTNHALNAQDIPQSVAPIDAAQVFEWWDDGLITPEEADEIFSRLEEKNYDEACLLAEVYAQEPCSDKSQVRQASRTKRKQAPSIIPHGHITIKEQYDSNGHLKKSREELHVQFYYFKLHLGSQELLSYRRDGFEAHFGQISTLEFHSHIPLDTLWGTALLYPVSKFRLGIFLDTSKAFHTHIGFKPNRENEITATFWKFQNANSIALQARTTLGQISTWYQFGQDMPLVKIQLQSSKKWLSWKTTAYIHGDSIPQKLNLSKGIVENKLWASQTVNAEWPEALNTQLSLKARVLSAASSDSMSARFKLSIESGPERLRPSLSVTCIEASDNCNKTEWKSGIKTSWNQLTLKASVLFSHENHTKPPKIEFSANYRSSIAATKLAIKLPEANPAQALSVQNEISLDTAPLGCNLAFAFKKTKTKNFRPNFANIQIMLKF